jgi:hypothetical protein
VWYAPDFGKTRLISIWELNKSGVSVTFKNKQAIARDDTGKELFRCNGQDGLYTLELIPLPAGTFYLPGLAGEIKSTSTPRHFTGDTPTTTSIPDDDVRGGETESED